jgi:XTP/dITP diphosphohydrolase
MARSKILIATNNAHKIVELRRLLVHLDVELVTPAELGIELDVAEEGVTFHENATLKARAFAEASRLPSLADDSGIEVDALEGGPGVRSARYGGPGLDDDDRLDLLLRELEGVPDEARACRYRVALVIAEPGGGEEAVEGACGGRVAHERAGANGFGYDPIFFVPAYGRTIAQLDPAEKDAISHRGEAARAMTKLLAARTSGSAARSAGPYRYPRNRRALDG